MSNLSPAAREIIAGRHADSFCYLGPHTENNDPSYAYSCPMRDVWW
jgi:hypothetical protein